MGSACRGGTGRDSLNFELCKPVKRNSLPHNSPFLANNSTGRKKQGEKIMKATGIVRRVDDLGRIVIPKEIRRTLRIREGDPSQISLTPSEKFCFGMLDLAKRQGW